MTDIQKIENQLGEIKFRRKLVQQQLAGEISLEDEFSGEEMAEILHERMETTLSVVSDLQESGVRISPYIEIGAERGQRSLVLESDLDAKGAAADISFDMLKSCLHYSKVFGKKQMPLRLCADLYHMPVRSNSVPFIFCYQTLHHFPDPTPVINEMHRVLQPGGNMYFAEEPYKRGFHLPLYKASSNFSAKHRNRNVLRKVLDHLFAKEICNEVDHGVLENDEIPLKKWRQTLSVFEQKRVRIKSLPVESDLYRPESPLRYLFNWLWGGEIKGILTKAGSIPETSPPLKETLSCVECLAKGEEAELIEGDRCYTCSECGCIYPVHEGVVFLINPRNRRELYPELEV